MSMCNQYESQSKTTNNVGTFGPKTKTAAKDPHEKEKNYISRGSARSLTEGMQQTALGSSEQRQARLQQRRLQQRRPTGDGKQWRLRRRQVKREQVHVNFKTLS